MAAGRFSAPGTEYGPCEDEDCGHTDCDLTRAQAMMPCDICIKPIGYDTRFYALNNSNHVHADCYEQEDADASVAAGPGSYLGDPPDAQEG